MDTLIKLVDGEISVNPEVLNNKCFRDLIRRDRGGMIEGDSNGVKKYRAMAELGLIWYCVNLNSPGIQRGLTGKELEDAGRAFFRIPDVWKKDDVYNRAYEEYTISYLDNAVVRSIKNILRGLDQTIAVTDTINNLIKSKSYDANLTIDGISEILKLNSELMKIASNLPDTVTILKALELSYLKEEQKLKKGRGGLTITSSMNPPIN